MCVLGNSISCGMPARHTPVNKGGDLEVLLAMGVKLGVEKSTENRLLDAPFCTHRCSTAGVEL